MKLFFIIKLVTVSLEFLQIEYDGLSGRMEFGANGTRTFFTLNIIEAMQMRGFRSLGTWDSYRGVKHRRNESQLFQETNYLSIANKTLHVVSKIVSKL